MSGESFPWISGNLEIDKAVMDEIERDALDCYPSESCGFVFGPADEPALLDAVQREENEADKYHKLDPVTFPRTSNMYFKINELRAARTFEQGRTDGRPVKVIYHSHCDAGAYFSEEDAATFANDGQLMWPCAYIVVSIMNGKVAERRLWVHQPGTNDFVESTLTVREP
ncbi:MAG: Mov34/MPN/PAD-1 family protein [Polyangiales bacterium]